MKHKPLRRALEAQRQFVRVNIDDLSRQIFRGRNYGKRAARNLVCKNCGGEGHFAKTCKNSPKVATTAPSELPDKDIAAIVKEERTLELAP